MKEKMTTSALVEFVALKECFNQLSPLDYSAQTRILKYLEQRLSADFVNATTESPTTLLPEKK